MRRADEKRLNRTQMLQILEYIFKPKHEQYNKEPGERKKIEFKTASKQK